MFIFCFFASKYLSSRLTASMCGKAGKSQFSWKYKTGENVNINKRAEGENICYATFRLVWHIWLFLFIESLSQKAINELVQISRQWHQSDFNKNKNRNGQFWIVLRALIFPLLMLSRERKSFVHNEDDFLGFEVSFWQGNRILMFNGKLSFLKMLKLLFYALKSLNIYVLSCKH